MTIMQVATPYETVPPKTYGGGERIIHSLSSHCRKAHTVITACPKDSKVSGGKISFLGNTIREYDRKAEVLHFLHSLEYAKKIKADIVHCHSWQFSMFSELSGIKTVFTLHSDVDSRVVPYISESVHFVAISDAQKNRMTKIGLKNVHRIYNGIPVEAYRYSLKPGGYAVFLGNFSPVKGAHTAIRVAKMCGVPIILAGKIWPYQQEYFKRQILPEIDGTSCKFIGEVDDREKNRLLKGALCLLFPVEWEEPFGLVVTEAMACGTPVLAFRRGSVPEIIEDGETGFIVDNAEQMTARLKDVPMLRRNKCRQTAEDNFNDTLMANSYQKLYGQLTSRKGSLKF